MSNQQLKSSLFGKGSSRTSMPQMAQMTPNNNAFSEIELGNKENSKNAEKNEVERQSEPKYRRLSKMLTLKEGVQFINVTSRKNSKRNSKFVDGKLKSSPTKIPAFESLEEPKIEEDLSNKKTFRQVLDSFFSAKRRKQNIQAFICFISLFSSLFYIACTYYPAMFFILDYLDFGVCIIYLCEYSINFCLAHHRLNWVLSTESILDLLTSVPPMFSLTSQGMDNNALLNFVNISRVLRIIRFFRLFLIYKSGENDVKKQIWMIINTLIMLVLICSGIIQIVEKDEVERRISLTVDVFTRDQLLMRTKFHHYIYFIVVTISTVGYGDIVPYTLMGKLIVMGLIFFTIVLIPKQTNDLIQLMSAQSEYARKRYTASNDVSHIILTGDISLDSLKSFCQELFHPDHGTQYRHAVIINSQLPSREMELFLNEKGNDGKIFYLEGDPMNEKDLLRADIGKARACIIFNNKNSHDSYSSDHQNLLLGLYIKKFVYNINHDILENPVPRESITDLAIANSANTNFRLCIQLIKPESKYHYFNSLQSIYKKRMPPDQLIIIEEIKMNLLSKSCITPGILTLISNLVMSASTLPNGNDSEWLKEYSEGRGHEIYRIQLSDYYKNYNFLDLVKEVYSQAQAILFAIEFEIDKTTVIKMNPGATGTINSLINNLYTTHKDYGSNNISESNKYDSGFKSMIENENVYDKYIESKVKVFAYLICSDKSVADNVANKERLEFRKKSLGMSINPEKLVVTPFESKKTKVSRPINNNQEGDSDEESQNSDIENNNLVNGIGEDIEISPEDYFIKSNAKNEYIIDTNIDIMQHTIKDSEDIINHVIVCGIHPALIHFILPLRAKYLCEENLKYIVILAPYLPQNLYDCFKRFPKIIFIQGSPLLPENLYRANIMEADKAVILSLGETKIDKEAINKKNDNNLNVTDTEIQMLDAESIFIYKAIKKCNKNIQIMTELISTSNVEYLLHKNYLKNSFFRQDFLPLYEFTPLFAAGEVFTPAIIDRITCQSYYSQHLLTILDQLLNGGTRGKNRKIRKLEEDLKLQGSNLWLVRVPEALVSETFEELFSHLIKSHKVVAIALYRRNSAEDLYYVYTNPKKTTLIHDQDLVFLLGHYNNIIDLLEERDDDEFFKNNKKLISSVKPKKNNDSDSSSGGEIIPTGSINQRSPKVRSVNSSPVNMNKQFPDGMINSKQDESNTFGIKRRQSTATFRGIYNSLNEKNKMMSQDDKKEGNSSKYLEIETLKKRIVNIQTEIEKLKDSYTNLPHELEDYINGEIENEMKVYLERSFDN